MIKLSDIKVGSIVWVKTDFGQGKSVQALVDEVEDDVKNGLPGISYTIKGSDDADGGWAYLSQVDRVVKY